MNHRHDLPTASVGLPVEPAATFDLLSDVLLGLVAHAAHDDGYRDALAGRTIALIDELADRLRDVERGWPTWSGWASLTVPDSDFTPRSPGRAGSQ